jgi:hypothetical protein
MKGRVVNIKRFPNEGLSLLTISIGGVKQLEIDDFVELQHTKKPKAKQKKLKTFFCKPFCWPNSKPKCARCGYAVYFEYV